LSGVDAIIVLDCGATTLRAIAVGCDGRLLAQSSSTNETVDQPGAPGLRIWPFERIWEKLCDVTRQVVAKIKASELAGVIVATWGADGAPVDRDGALAYPVISWQCNRTAELARRICELLSPWTIFRISGYQVMSINTLLKLMWLRENCPEAIKPGNRWLMMPGLVSLKLGAEQHIDPTSASTMMAMDLSKRDWSSKLLGLAGLDPSFFPEWREPGSVVGNVTKEAERATGIPSGTPILAGGHDTQFALIGSGAMAEEAILSSGTWEILAFRADSFRPTREGFRGGVIFEADAARGLWDPQILMMGSGVLEWIRSRFFSDVAQTDYDALERAGREVPPGSRGVTVIPSFVSDSGPMRQFGTKGTILGLGLNTGRAEVYRAALEGLSFQLRQALEILSASTGIRPKGLRVVGGGSKNELWNQIRADVTGLPVSVTSQRQATVLGAAMVGFAGLGRFDSPESAMRSIEMEITTVRPGDASRQYVLAYQKYVRLGPRLKGFYLPSQ